MREGAQHIANRPIGSPLIAIFDWEVPDQEMAVARTAYGKNGAICVIRMNKDHCFMEMRADIKGIERFSPPSIFKAAHDAGECTVGFSATGNVSISKAQLDKAKSAMLKRLLSVKDHAKLDPLKKVIADIEQAIDRKLDLD